MVPESGRGEHEDPIARMYGAFGPDVTSGDAPPPAGRAPGRAAIPGQRAGEGASRHAPQIGTPAAGGTYVPGVYRGAITEHFPGPEHDPDHGERRPPRHPLAAFRIPLHLAALFDHRLTADPAPFYVRFANRHQVAVLAAAPWALAGLGWWINASEPLHDAIAAACDVLALAMGFGAAWSHRPHGKDADPLITRGLLLLSAVTAMLGISAGAGARPVGYAAAGIGSAAALGVRYAVHRARYERAQDVAVEMAAQLAPQAGQPGAATDDAEPVFDSPYDARLYAAFRHAGIDKVAIRAVRISAYNPHTWEAVLALPPGRVSRDQVVRNKREVIATNLGCRRLEMVAGPRKDEVVLTVYDGPDRLLDWMAWHPDMQVADFLEPVPIGFDEDHQLLRVELAWVHTLIAAQTGAGKSGVFNAILLNTLRAGNLVRIGIDAKAGAPELGPYRPAFHALADTPALGHKVLHGVKALINERGLILEEISRKTGRAVRRWSSAYGPIVLLAIEELAELTRAIPGGAKILESILQLGRYVGVCVISGTQVPSAKVFGGDTDPRQQYAVRIGLRSTESTVINSVFGPGAQGRGWLLNELAHKGKFMIEAVGHERPRVYRAFQLDDEDGASRMIPDAVARAVADGAILDFAAADPRSCAAFRAGAEERYHSRDSDLLWRLFSEEFPDGWAPVGEQGAQGEPTAAAAGTQGGWSVPRPPDPAPGPRYPGGDPVPEHLRQLWLALLARREAEIGQLADLGFPGLASREPVRKALERWRAAGYLTAGKPPGARSRRYRVHDSVYGPQNGPDQGRQG